MSTKMTKEEREAFLADVHVGVISLGREDRAPLTVPIWYDYRPGGEVWVLTGPTSAKGQLLAVGAEAALCTQTETPPYKYLTVECEVTSVAPADLEKDARPMARRYLGEAMGDAYITQTGEDHGVVVRMKPLRWLSVDYSKEFAAT